MSGLNQLSFCQALARIDQGESSTEALINACYDQIESREDAVGAWHFLLSREDYLEQYFANRDFYDGSRLKGLPVGIKDIIDTAGMPSEMGSVLHKGRVPVDDASCVSLLKNAGAIVPGKTVTTEFAYFAPGKTRNPRDLERTPGGSSSGSAASVADCMVPAALGSQTAASVIRPAAFCGVVGYVGTRGEFSLRGVQPLGQSLDSLGMFARTTEDIQLLRSVLLRQDSAVNLEPKQNARILVCRGSSVGECDEAMEQAIQDTCERLSGQGVELVEMHTCDLIKRLVDCHHKIMAWEARRNLAVEAEQPQLLSEPLQALLQLGATMSRDHYLEALDTVAKIGHWLWNNPDHQGADAVLAPAAPGVAPVGHASTGQPHMSRPWQVLGLPEVTLPGLTDHAGMPLGIQLIGRPRQDDQLLALARWVETLIS